MNTLETIIDELVADEQATNGAFPSRYHAHHVANLRRLLIEKGLWPHPEAHSGRIQNPASFHALESIFADALRHH